MLKDGVRVAGCRAIVAEGGDLLVKGCCFQGLDTAVEVHPIGGSTTELEETMIIPARNQSLIAQTSPSTSSGDETFGWGIKMQLFPGGRTTTRRLVLKHCTLVGQGLLQLGGFSPDSPVHVDMRECAIQATTLVGWLPSSTARTWTHREFVWKGEGNQLDITGQSWVVPVGKVPPGVETGEMSRDQWLKLFESNPISGPIQFSDRPESSSRSNGPADFRVKPTGQGRIGANPELVGPKGS
jgi:hypothetical protein